MFKKRTRRDFTTALPAWRLLFFLLLAMFATEHEAKAYTDPGSGALIWQALAAAAVGSLYYLRRIALWFKTRRARRD